MKDSSTKSQAKANRLINETSTYLLQHAYNPVDWHAWDAEALAKAKAEDKPILLSVGYAACHWCHVMEHESFEDVDTAQLMNEYFINIKVDREERTDLDEIYMKAVQMMTGQGGWPMTVFLTPELKPFFGGTYFPPVDKHGLPSFKRLLRGIHEAWTTQRDDVTKSSNELTNHLKHMDHVEKPDDGIELNYGQIDLAFDKLQRLFDPEWGGFGGAPKFPHTFSLNLCLRYAAPNARSKGSGKEDALTIARTSLDKMAYGGMHDQIGGGFARYSVDRQWLIPHFEKMLYDNALLCQSYLEGYRLTGRKYWADVARNIIQFAVRELKTEVGGFYSSLDADSEGEEGKFYVWTPEQLQNVLGDEADWFAQTYCVTKIGNFEHGTSALHLVGAPEELAKKSKMSVDDFWQKVDRLSKLLMKKRDERIRPGRDEKVLTSWNSLMISALVEAYRTLSDVTYLQLAIETTEFIFQNLMREGKLLRTWGKGKAKLNGYLDDYSYFIVALLDLASVDPNPKWFLEAQRLSEIMLKHFWDDSHHGFFYTSDDHEQLVTRPKSHHDGAIPSGSSVAVFALLRLARLTNNQSYEEKAVQVLKLYSAYTAKMPDQFSHFLCALDLYLADHVEIACILPETEQTQTSIAAVESIYSCYLPNKVVQVAHANAQATTGSLLEGRTTVDGKPTTYICRNFTCHEPMTDQTKIQQALRDMAQRAVP